jgi:hypothetical protein
MSYHPSIPVIVIISFGFLVYLGGKSNIKTKESQEKLVPTENTWTDTRYHDDKPESDIEVKSPNGDSFGLSLYAGGVPFQNKQQAEANRSAADGKKWTYKWVVHRYPIDFDTDIGAWAGFRVASPEGNKPEGETGFDIGLRYSPVRLGYGVISPDLLVSPRQAGIGVSVYAPAQSVSYPYNKIGIGLGYLADYDGGSGWTPYASLSTRF